METIQKGTSLWEILILSTKKAFSPQQNSPTSCLNWSSFRRENISFYFLTPDHRFYSPQWTKTLASIAYWDTKDLPHTTFCPTIHSKYKYRYQSPHYITQQIQIRVSKIPDINTVHCAAMFYITQSRSESFWVLQPSSAQILTQEWSDCLKSAYHS